MTEVSISREKAGFVGFSSNLLELIGEIGGLITICKFIWDMLARLKSIRIVGYEKDIIFTRNEQIDLQDDSSFKPFAKIMIFSPSFFTSREQAEKVEETCKHVADIELKQAILEHRRERGKWILWDIESLRIWSPRNLRATFKWRGHRKQLEEFSVLGVNLKEIGLRNWKSYCSKE